MNTRKKQKLLNLIKQYKLNLSQIPYSQYEQNDSTQKQFKESFIDFRFQILFKDDKQSYKRFYNRYNSGAPIYAMFKGRNLIITDNIIKKTNKGINMAYCLPDNWYKIAKISR